VPAIKHGEGSSTPQNIDFPVFGYRVGVVFSTNVPRTVQQYFSNFDDSADTEACHCPCKNEGKAMLFMPFAVEPGTIAHECYHAVRRMLSYEDVGLYEVDDESRIDNETVAYHLGYLVKHVIAFQKIANKQRRDFLAKHKRTKKSRRR
jgi:hypothetical protein